MNRQVKKIFKISGIMLGIVFLVLFVVIVFVINFIVILKKLILVVLDVVNQILNVYLDMESVELIFFLIFLQFGLKVKNGSLVFKVLNDSSWCKIDLLLFFKECVLIVNLIVYLMENCIVVYNFLLEEVVVYVYWNKVGKVNWEVICVLVDMILVDIVLIDFNSEIDIWNIEFKYVNFVFDDWNMDIYLCIDDVNLKLRFLLIKGIFILGLKFDNKNIFFWQQGELLVNKIVIFLWIDIMVDRQIVVWKLKDMEFDVNGIWLDVNGIFWWDIVVKIIGMDLEYGLYVFLMEMVLWMILKLYVKDSKVLVKGEVIVSGRVRGVYGDKKLFVVLFKIGIKEVLV